jgi:acetyltransferase-like isoleucine patch superfamily enzyme
LNIRTIAKAGTSLLRNIFLKLRHGHNYKCTFINTYSLSTEIWIHRGGKLSIGNHFSTLKNVHVSVASGASVSIGNNVNVNQSCSIVAKDEIVIGNEVIFGPGCRIYDHDHDYRKVMKARKETFLCAPVRVGDGVWFGANCIVLRGSVIGDNCVFGAGCIIKGEYPKNTLVIQEKKETQKLINIEM